MKWIIAVLLLLCCAGAFFYQRYSLEQRGEETFTRLGCTGCHFSGAGPNLTHVAKKYDEKLLTRFILDPQTVYRERNMQSLNAGYMLMPGLNPTPKETRAIIAYLKEIDKEP